MLVHTFNPHTPKAEEGRPYNFGIRNQTDIGENIVIDEVRNNIITLFMSQWFIVLFAKCKIVGNLESKTIILLGFSSGHKNFKTTKSHRIYICFQISLW